MMPPTIAEHPPTGGVSDARIDREADPAGRDGRGDGAAEEGRRASGLRPGEEVSAWEPMHVAGPHAGTKTCPVCTYLEAPVLLAFARDMAAAEPLAAPLEEIARATARGNSR